MKWNKWKERKEKERKRESRREGKGEREIERERGRYRQPKSKSSFRLTSEIPPDPTFPSRDSVFFTSPFPVCSNFALSLETDLLSSILFSLTNISFESKKLGINPTSFSVNNSPHPVEFSMKFSWDWFLNW